MANGPKAGVMTSKVMHGTKPIELPTKFEMVINLKTAKALILMMLVF
jgi:hypothetical protein